MPLYRETCRQLVSQDNAAHSAQTLPGMSRAEWLVSQSQGEVVCIWSGFINPTWRCARIDLVPERREKLIRSRSCWVGNDEWS
ncbi:hypothetical protein PoB_003094700 [Plakobranchus ocellatus]|uniref:Uncharacterized protein n=1 Tax=Plakobranchus ocellatus TaxID=259542 RepID=A0AAV4ABP1_9GAST|nr:hypothetical protein PoB_003094700 [Plakobranchus ocellatus]